MVTFLHDVPPEVAREAMALFPAEFQRRVVRERLGITDEMDGGHLVALSRPAELVDRLEAYRAEAGLR